MTDLYELIGKALKLPPRIAVSDTLSMANTVDWDSLAHMDLILTLEEHYGISLDADEIVAMRSVCGVKEVLAARGLLPAQ